MRLLLQWSEQVRYEEIRPIVLFGGSVVEGRIPSLFRSSSSARGARAAVLDDEGGDGAHRGPVVEDRVRQPEVRAPTFRSEVAAHVASGAAVELRDVGIVVASPL
ncbi:hypothetical protein BH24ACT19_BH24ACT19_19230 [soil metagenome]